MATEDECRAGILSEWAKQKPNRRSKRIERMDFYFWLHRYRPDLLDFPVSIGQDVWQIVSEWLKGHEEGTVLQPAV